MSTENSADTYTNLRIMNWIEIIDKAFHLYRKHFLLFIGISIIYTILSISVDELIEFLWKNNPYGLIEKITGSLLSQLTIGVFVIAATEIYFQRQITIQDSFQRFKNIHPRYLFSVFIYLLPSLLPLLSIPLSLRLLIRGDMFAISFPPPGTIFSLSLLTYSVTTYFEITWQVYVPVIVVEGGMKPKPLRRSRDLIRKSWWRVFGTIHTLSILLRAIHLIFVVSFVLLLGMFGLMGDASVWDIVEYVLRSSVGYFSGKPLPFELGSTTDVILISLRIIASVLTTPLFAITIMVIYFNQRVKREGFDIEMTAS